MSQVLLFTPPFFRGTISDTPSGTAYHVKPGDTVVAPQDDLTILLKLGFSPAAPNTDQGNNMLYTVTYPISRLQLLSLNSSPVEILPAQAGKIIVPLSMAITYAPGDDVLPGATTNLIYTSNPDVAVMTFDGTDPNGNEPFGGSNDQSFYTATSSGNFNSEAVGVGVSFQTSVDLGAGQGPIATATINNGGGGVAVGATGTLNGGNNDATYEVTAVNCAAPIVAIDAGGGNANITFGPGDFTSIIDSTALVIIYGSTDNDGNYTTIALSSYSEPNTIVQITGPLPNESDVTGQLIGGFSTTTGFILTDDGSGYSVANGVATTPTGPVPGPNIVFDITSVDDTPPANSGTAKVTVTYELVDAP